MYRQHARRQRLAVHTSCTGNETFCRLEALSAESLFLCQRGSAGLFRDKATEGQDGFGLSQDD